MEIISLQHSLIKHWVLLRKDREYRQTEKSLLLVGEKLLDEYPHSLKYCISSKQVHRKAQMHVMVTEEILHKISGLENFQGVIGEVALPEPQSIEDKQWILILDQIQDPGNLGTLLRTALALGWEAVITTQGTVDLFNDKALRASQGAIFHLPFAHLTPNEILDWVKRKNVQIYAADMEGTPVEKQIPKPPIALVLSHEGQGMLPWAQKLDLKISIPLKNNVESLNVAVAGAILLHQMKRLCCL